MVALASLFNAQTRDSRTEHNVDTSKGIRLFEAGDTAAAIATLLNAVKTRPDDAEAWHYLGRSYNRLAKTEEAITAFQHAVKLSLLDSKVK